MLEDYKTDNRITLYSMMNDTFFQDRQALLCFNDDNLKIESLTLEHKEKQKNKFFQHDKAMYEI